jgi:hypothetical protein
MKIVTPTVKLINEDWEHLETLAKQEGFPTVELYIEELLRSNIQMVLYDNGYKG